MSRRKQGRPQQRLTLDTVEQENDLLVCGDCQMNFPLHDITKFIRHKVNRCNKENVNCESEPFEGEGDNDDPDKVIGNKPIPISAPITRKESVDGSAKSPRQAIDSSLEVKQEKAETEESPVKEEEKDVKDRLPFRLKQVDAESNTTNSEPIKFTCEQCRKVFGSAWSLLQHAQREHGMRIYVTASRDSLTPSHSPRGSTPSQKTPKPDDLNKDIDRYKDDRKHKEDGLGKERRSDSTEPHRATSSVGSASSGEGPLSGHPSPHNPFMFPPRMPFDVRHPLSPIPGMGHLGRPGDLRLDFTGDLFQHRGIPGLFNIPGMDHGPGAPFHPYEQRRSMGGMSPDDLFSQRLRQLANSTSPSPGSKRTPPFAPTTNAPNRIQGMFSSLTPPASNTTDVEKRMENPRSLTPPGNQKSCEFCGKTFRFQSNLIVHRRSHTGEKPFKCPLCPHACTQQSKLKRHMKTHMSKSGGGLSGGSNMSNASEGSHASSSSTPDSNKLGDDDDDAEDEEEEEEMEEEEEEPDMAAYQALRDEQRMAEMNDRRESEQIKHNSKHPDGKSELVARLFDRRIEETITTELSKSTDPQKKPTLLSEVIERTGLTGIPNYNEALKLAMAESTGQSKENGHHKNSPHGEGNQKKIVMEEEEREHGAKRDKPDDDEQESGIMSISKMIKKEPSSEKTGPIQKEPLRSNNSIDPFYHGFWYPTGHADFFRGLQIPRYTGLPESVGNLHHNGFGLTSSAESPLPSSTPTSTASAVSTPLGNTESSVASAQRKDKLRNDTCEFCGKVFKNCSNLTVHRRSHTGEKPYKCMLCNYACAQSSKLTRHMKTHGRFGKDVYKCKFCQMPFSVPSTLEKHMRKCVENKAAPAISVDGEDTNSNSDTTSASDSMSAPPNASPMTLPTTHLSLASSLGLPLFSVPGAFEKQMRKTLENNNTAADGDDTGSNSDAASTSEGILNSAVTSLPSNVSPLGLPTSSLSSQLAATGVPLGLPQSFGMSGSGLKLEPNISVKLESNMGLKLEANMNTSSSI